MRAMAVQSPLQAGCTLVASSFYELVAWLTLLVWQVQASFSVISEAH
jgi:hypothetical protein